MRRALKAAILLAAIRGCAGGRAAAEEMAQYGPLDGQSVAITVPDTPAGPLPGVVLIHGGGWHSGDKRDVAAVATRIAAGGFVVFNIDYRLFTTPGRLPWPATQVGDAQLAVRWARNHAAAYRLDPCRLCSLGFSAGGHLALFLAALASPAASDSAALIPDQSPRVDCAVDFFGPTDLARETGSLTRTIHTLLGGTPEAVPRRYADASPLTFVDRTTAPVFVSHGRRDDTVSFEQARLLDARLTRADVRHVFRPFDAGHSFHGLHEEQVDALLTQAMGFMIASTSRKP